MRALLVTSVGVTCAAALTLPLAAPALSAPASLSASARPPSVSPESPGSGPPSSVRAEAPSPRAAELAGSTQSLPLEPLAAPSDRVAGAAAGQGLAQRDARPFSLVGVVWDDADAELHGTVQVRTRATGGEGWSDWQDVETHNAEHAADLGSAERSTGAVRGATAPLWVGDSDGVEVRVRPEAADPQHRAAVPLPEGLRLELVDPGEDPVAETTPESAPESATETGSEPAPEPARAAPV
ncbi:N-acetylmuramoyl-L-alanine amidase, partial [Streptomyces sp. ID01-9D]|nr:N-acetylmuramoyl-L-alanine amidase [Streptomyces sp. ID01-9D]